MASPSININDLNENVFDELFDYLSIDERVRCESVCRKWRSLLTKRAQKVIKLCFKSHSNPTKQICPTSVHQPTSNDVVYFDADSVDCVKIDRLFAKFTCVKSVHLESDDVKLLKRSNVLSTLSKHVHNVEHFQIELFEGPFTCNDLRLLFNQGWLSGLRHLVIRFQNDNGKILNRKTIMKFFEICIALELFYWKAPYLCMQNLEYVPLKLSSLHLNDTELDLESLLMLVQANKSVLKQLRLSNVTGGHLDCITANSAFLDLLSVDCIQLDATERFDVLYDIARLERLEVLRFWLDDGQQVNTIDREITSIIKACHRMRKVHIENAIITDGCLVLVSVFWRNLQSFKLYSRFDRTRSITDRTLNEFLKLKHIHTLALPNYSFSQSLLERLIDLPKFGYLVVREPCSFVDQLFNRFVAKASAAKHNKYKLKINDEQSFIALSTTSKPTNFEFKQAKIFNFDLF